MQYLADTDQLVKEGILTPAQARIIQDRARGAMLALGVNSLLAGGIIAAAAGFIFWLGDALAVAAVGAGFLLAGLWGLARAGQTIG